jgi:hypothetical protein
MRIGHACLTAFLGLSVATVVAEAGALGVLWARGGLTREKLVHLTAVAHDVDLTELWHEMESAAHVQDQDQLSYEEVVRARDCAAVDLDLRDMTVDEGRDGLRQLEAQLVGQRTQYTQIKASFDRQLEQLRQGAVDASLREVQRQLESVQPQLAKDQLLRILDDPTLDRDNALHFVVTLFKALPLDKRKKLVAEFKGEETERLHEILREIRRGVPEVTLIRDTRNRLQEFEDQGLSSRSADAQVTY